MNRKTQLTLGRQNDQIFIPSTMPSTREDTSLLEERFNQMLYNEYALETGLCSKRRRIYDDLFAELIRITKVHCSERGLLLERIRNESIQWINTYEELYASSMAYSIRQYVQKLEEEKRMESKIEELENDCQQLRKELAQQSNRSLPTHAVDRLKGDVQFLRSTNAKLQNNLEKVLNEKLQSDIFLGDPIDYQRNKQH